VAEIANGARIRARARGGCKTPLAFLLNPQLKFDKKGEIE